MTPHEQVERAFDAFVLMFLGLFGFVVSNFNAILGNIFLVLSIAYLVWRWRIDYIKNKKGKYGK